MLYVEQTEPAWRLRGGREKRSRSHRVWETAGASRGRWYSTGGRSSAGRSTSYAVCTSPVTPAPTSVFSTEKRREGHCVLLLTMNPGNKCPIPATTGNTKVLGRPWLRRVFLFCIISKMYRRRKRKLADFGSWCAYARLMQT